MNKARVAGIDRYQTKTGEDRRIELRPRALAVLKRQLALRARLEATDAIGHDHVFFRETGEPLESADSGEALARDAELAEAPVSQTLYRAALFSELEPHDRQEPVVGRNTPWAQHLHNAACLCRMGGRGGRIRRRRHQAIHESPRSPEAHH